jgi:hypothetical protein
MFVSSMVVQKIGKKELSGKKRGDQKKIVRRKLEGTKGIL